MVPVPYRCWVEVSRRQLAENFNHICTTVGPEIEVMPVVKADAYRHGAREVARVLTHEGARWLAVSNVEEGANLRASGISARILIMGDYLPFERAALIDQQLTPAIHSTAQMLDYDRMAVAVERPLPFHLSLDTGMSRLGTREEASRLIEALSQLRAARFEGLMTHFASAANYRTDQTDRQIARFNEVRCALEQAGFKPQYTHLSSTIPVAYCRKPAWGNLVRPGHAIYGYVSPTLGEAPVASVQVKPALSWKARILEIKEVPTGAQVGYGGIFTAERPTRMAVLAVGYADGLPHRLSNKGKVIAGGRFAPILGAISMDLTTIDITDSPNLHPGDPVTLLGQEGNCKLDAQQIAKLAGTISYSVLCGIGQRVKHVYL